jgi:hypothetical protein
VHKGHAYGALTDGVLEKSKNQSKRTYLHQRSFAGSFRKISKTGSWQLFHSERDLYKTPELERITKSKNSPVAAHNRCEGNLCMF